MIVYLALLGGMWWAFFSFLRIEEGYWVLIPLFIFSVGLVGASAASFGLG